VIAEIEARGLGKKTNQIIVCVTLYSAGSATGASRILFIMRTEIPKAVDENDLPIILPEVDKYLPTEDGEPAAGQSKKTGSIKTILTLKRQRCPDGPAAVGITCVTWTRTMKKHLLHRMH